MDIIQLTNILVSILAGGIVTSLAVQLLKSPLISFIKAERYPRITAAVVSAVATVVALIQSGVTLSFVANTPQVIVAVGGGILLIAASTYNAVLKIEKDEEYPEPADKGYGPSDAIDQEPTTLESANDQPAAVAASEPELADQPADSGLSDSYVVVAGDTPEKISKKVGVPYEKIAEASGIDSAAVIHPDQVLKIPR